MISSFGRTDGATRTGTSTVVFLSNNAVVDGVGGGGGVSPPNEMLLAPPGALTTFVDGRFRLISLLVSVDMFGFRR